MIILRVAGVHRARSIMAESDVKASLSAVGITTWIRSLVVVSSDIPDALSVQVLLDQETGVVHKMHILAVQKQMVNGVAPRFAPSAPTKKTVRVKKEVGVVVFKSIDMLVIMNIGKHFWHLFVCF